MNGLCSPSVPRPSSIPGVVLILYVTLLSLRIYAVYRQQRCRVLHCHSRNASPSIARQWGRNLFLSLLLRTFQAVCCGQHCNFSSPQSSDLCFMRANVLEVRKVNWLCLSTPEIQYYDMSITGAKKGKEMRPKCVALTGAGVQTRHHPNFKSRSATSSFRCGFHSTAPFVNSVLHSVTVKGINFKIDCTHRKPSMYMFGSAPNSRTFPRTSCSRMHPEEAPSRQVDQA